MVRTRVDKLREIFPEDLKRQKRFTAWKQCLPPVVDGQFKGKGRKLPVSPESGWAAAIDDPDTWGTFEEAASRMEQDHLAGIMIAFVDSDDLMGIDLDHCRDPLTGEIEAWAQNVITDIDSYCEVSPSGTGVKIFVKADPDLYGGKVPPKNSIYHDNIEVFKNKRFFTMTGHTMKEDG